MTYFVHIFMIQFIYRKLTKPTGKMSRVRIRVKSGDVEIEYEGEFEKLAGAVTAINKKLVEVPGSSATPKGATKKLPTAQKEKGAPTAEADPTYSTSTIVTILDDDSGPGIITAAAAKLTFADKKDRFSRDDLLHEVKNAIQYKKSHGGNFAANLNRMVSGDKLRVDDKGNYALSPKERRRLQEELSNSEE